MNKVLLSQLIRHAFGLFNQSIKMEKTQFGQKMKLISQSTTKINPPVMMFIEDFTKVHL